MTTFKVEVLGSGCKKCQQLEANAKTAIATLGIEAEVSHVTDVVEIAKRGVMSTPALVGVITPFCSCSAVPLFIGFLEAGVPLGVTFSYLIAAPIVNEVAVILL